ncbi:MAG: alpha-amylase family glycosyl hydrolase, partial [Enterococcus italicus]
SDPIRNELSMVFQFEHIGLDQQEGKDKWDLKPLSIGQLKQILSKWQTSLGHEGWNSLFWNNHDLPRIVSRWGNDKEYRVESAKMFAIVLHMMKGTPYIYQGEEIGMTNCPISTIDEVDDIESINMYNERLDQGYTKEAIIESINAKGRDNARTPVQWDNSANAGFTTGTPWLHVNPNYPEINVKQSLADEDSVFYTYKKLIELRKEHAIVVWGEYELIEETEEEVFAYYREFSGEKWLVVANFSESKQTFTLEEEIGEVLVHNYHTSLPKSGEVSLKPYEAFAAKILKNV